MKRLAVVALIGVVLLGMLSIARAAEPTIKLKFSNFFPPTYKYSILVGQFCDEIKKRTHGRVEIVHYPGGTLSSAPKMFNAVVEGICDIGLSTVAYNKGRFPLAEAQDLPLNFPSGWVGTQVSNDFIKKFKPKEWDAVHVLYLYGNGPNMVQTLKKPVKTLEDMKGLKIRAVGRTADAVTALGATPVPIEMVDLYESLRRGVVDGSMQPAEVLKGWKTGELIKYGTVVWKGVGSSFVFYVVMNKDKWNSMPADLKKVFDEVSEEWKEKQAIAVNELDIEGIEYLKQNGGQTIALSDAESQRWAKAAAPLLTEYKKDLVSKGYKPEEVDTYLGFIRERITFWRQKEKEKGIPTPFQ